MPPRQYSRYSFSVATPDDQGRVFMSPRIPFRFRVFADTTIYLVRQGDTLYALAGRYYAGLPRPAGLWWVIADFQPEPIVDPTIQLVPGSKLMIPSLRVLQELVFSETRRTESDV